MTTGRALLVSVNGSESDMSINAGCSPPYPFRVRTENAF
jgi:hypothetical protein